MNPLVLSTICLCFLDQITKRIISHFFMTADIDLIGTYLRFTPVQNTKFSYAGHFIKILSNNWILIVFNVMIIFLFISGYLFYKTKRKHTSFSVKLIMIFGLAGSLCSLADKLFWGGSLDFFQIPGAFVFDLKDVYLTVCEILFVVIGVRHSKEISIKEYLRFCYKKFRM